MTSVLPCFGVLAQTDVEHLSELRKILELLFFLERVRNATDVHDAVTPALRSVRNDNQSMYILSLFPSPPIFWKNFNLSRPRP